MEIKYWVLSGVVAILLAVLGWVFNSIAQRILNRLDAVITELQKLNNMMSKHEAQIEAIQEKLDNHEQRLYNIETKK